jgi:hypothetical protein
MATIDILDNLIASQCVCKNCIHVEHTLFGLWCPGPWSELGGFETVETQTCEEFYNKDIESRISELFDVELEERPYIYCDGECREDCKHFSNCQYWVKEIEAKNE